MIARTGVVIERSDGRRRDDQTTGGPGKASIWGRVTSK
jgi:hypothetical protein